jgi:anti-anti-sigma regulatory factor
MSQSSRSIPRPPADPWVEPGELFVHVQGRSPERTRVVVDGDLDLEGAAAFDLQVPRLLPGGGTVEVDLCGVRCIDASGCRSLCRLAEQLTSGPGMCLTGADAHVAALLAEAGLDLYVRSSDGATDPPER